MPFKGSGALVWFAGTINITPEKKWSNDIWVWIVIGKWWIVIEEKHFFVASVASLSDDAIHYRRRFDRSWHFYWFVSSRPDQNLWYNMQITSTKRVGIAIAVNNDHLILWRELEAGELDGCPENIVLWNKLVWFIFSQKINACFQAEKNTRSQYWSLFICSLTALSESIINSSS